jgi:hypothetical protein
LLENRLALSALRPRESVSPGAVTPDQAADSAAGLRAEGQTQGGPGLEHLTIGLRRSASVVAAVTPPQRVSRRRAGRHQLTEHQDRATTPEASSPRPRDRGRDRTGLWWQLGPRADGQPGWVDGERRERPPSYRGTPATLPALPANRPTPPGRRVGWRPGCRTFPWRVALEERLAGLQPLPRPRPCPVPPTPHRQTGGPKAPPAPLTPLRWLRARTATWLPRWPGHARGRLQSKKAGGSRPGGAMTGAAHTHHQPVTQIERLPNYSRYIRSRRGAAGRGVAACQAARPGLSKV